MTKARDLANASTALSAVSATELAFVDGVTSAIQTQMDAKLATTTATSTYIPKTLTTTTGDIIYASGANTPARLGIGTTDQVLKVTAGVPAWATPASGSTYVGVAATASGASMSVTGNTQHTLLFPTEDFDTDGFHSTATNTSRITIPTGKGGKYLINVGLDNDVACNYAYLYFVKNGTTTGLQTGPNGAFVSAIVDVARNSAKLFGSFVVALSASDYIEIGFQNSDTATMTYNARFSASYLGA
jgi:hypothetical protein